MLGEVFIAKAAREAMEKYSEEHYGKIGVNKMDIIRIVKGMGGDMDDVRAVIVAVLRDLSPLNGTFEFVE